MQGNSEKSFSDSKGVSTEKHGKTLWEDFSLSELLDDLTRYYDEKDKES